MTAPDVQAAKERAEALRQFALFGASLDLPTPKRTAQEVADAVDALAARVEQLETALRYADEQASVAHDAIWHESVRGEGGAGFDVLHSNDRDDSAQSAIWRLHDRARAALSVAAAGGQEDTPA